VPITASSVPSQNYTEINLRLVEGFDEWLMGLHYSSHTRLSYCGYTQRFAFFIGGDTSLRAVKRENVVEFLQYLQEGRSFNEKSLASVQYALRKFYKFLDLAGVLAGPMVKIPARQRVPKRLPRSLTEDQIEELFRGADTSPRDRAVLELLYGSGVRRAELTALNCQDLYFDNDGNGGSARILHGKGDKERVVIFGKYAAGALALYLKDRTTGPLFQTVTRTQRGTVDFHDGYKRTYWTGWWWEWKLLPNGKRKRVMHSQYLGTFEELPTRQMAEDALPRFIGKQPGAILPNNTPRRLSDKEVERIVKKAARKAGLGDITPHQLRHSFASHLLSHGADLLYICRLLGHSSPQTTTIYLHVTMPELMKTYAKCHPHGGEE